MRILPVGYLLFLYKRRYPTGDDEHLLIKLTNANIASRIPSFIEEKTRLFYQRVQVEIVDKILRNEAGKVINQ